MKKPLHISFGRSPSPQFGRAVRLAGELPGYKSEGQGRERRHRLMLDLCLDDDVLWEKLARLLHMICGWRSTSIEVEGRSLSAWKLLASAHQIRRCYREKRKHAAGAYYCSGKNTPTGEATRFGCRLCRGVSRGENFGRGAPWMEFGTLSSRLDSFQVDKKTIFQVLEHHAKEELCTLCPAFNWKHLRTDIEELPNVVTLDQDSPFEVRYSQLNPSKALGIRRKGDDEDEGPFLRHVFAMKEEEVPEEKRCVPSVRFADVAGQDKALAAVRQLVQLPLLHGDYFTSLGVEPQAGIVLYGPPGNGKTMLAKAVATECQAHLEIISGPEILSMWVGESEANLRRVFARCREFAPQRALDR